MVYFGKEAREKLAAGIHKLARAVVPTLGPKGRYAILRGKDSPPVITNDGVTIARAVEFEDPVEALGADLIREVATKTNEVAGDGTTTATLLADVLLTEGLKAVESGKNPVDIRSELAADGKKVVDYLRSIAREVKDEEELSKITTLSSRDSDIGKKVAELVWRLGKDHNITIQTGTSLGVETETAEGMQFDGGYISSAMMSDPSGKAIVDDSVILVTNKRIESVNEILPIMELVAESGKKHLVIIADAVQGDALKNIQLNIQQGNFRVTVIRPLGIPERQREVVQDIAAAVGAKAFYHEGQDDLRTATLDDLGHAKSVVATNRMTTIVGGVGLTDVRQAEIRGTLQITADPIERMVLEQRLGRLSGKVGVIRVLGTTDTETEEKKYRVEDALRAATATLQDGVIPGGGVALAEASKLIQSPILKVALEAPQKVLNKNAGYELPTEGVIDPFKVTHTALQNAISVASLILLSESICL